MRKTDKSTTGPKHDYLRGKKWKQTPAKYGLGASGTTKLRFHVVVEGVLTWGLEDLGVRSVSQKPGQVRSFTALDGVLRQADMS